MLFGANRPTTLLSAESTHIVASIRESHLDLLRMLLFLNASAADTVRAVAFFEGQTLIFCSTVLCSMIFFLKYGIGFNSFKLGFEVTNGTTMRTAIGATTGVGEIVAIVLRLITGCAPVVV